MPIKFPEKDKADSPESVNISSHVIKGKPVICPLVLLMLIGNCLPFLFLTESLAVSVGILVILDIMQIFWAFGSLHEYVTYKYVSRFNMLMLMLGLL